MKRGHCTGIVVHCAFCELAVIDAAGELDRALFKQRVGLYQTVCVTA